MATPETQPTSTRPCESCGAAVGFAPRELSTRCPYCDSPLVDVARGRQSVDLVAPFRIERKVATTKLREWLSDRWFAPEALRKLDVKDRALEGLFVPAWAVDGIADCEWRAQVGIVWYRTEHYTDSEGKRRTRTVREVEWFPASGTAVDQFDDHVSHAGGPIAAGTFNRLPPFDIGFAQPFDERWLSGFSAFAPDRPGAVPIEQIAAERREWAQRRIQSELLPGDQNRLTWVSAKVSIEHADRVLLPLWRVRWEHEGKPVDLWVHGQSGQCLGNVPTSTRKVVAAIALGITLIVIAVLLGRWLS